MPKIWHPNKASQFARQVQLGRPYYVVYRIAKHMAPYEDSKLYSEYVFDRRAPLTGTPMSGSVSAVGLCQRFGPVYEEPPVGMRNIAGPGRQVAGPVPEGYEAYLDEAEIRGLNKRVRDASDPRTRRF